MTSYASIEGCGLEWKRQNGKVDEVAVPDEDVPDTESFELLLQRDTGWTQDVGVVDAGVESVRENLNAKLTPAQHSVPAAFEEVLDLSRETLASVMNFEDV